MVLKTKKYKFKCSNQLKAFSVTNRASCQSNVNSSNTKSFPIHVYHKLILKWVVLALDLQEKDPVCSCGTTCMEEELECWEFTSRVKMGNKLWSSPRQEIRVDYGGLAKLHFSPQFSLTGWVAQMSVIWNKTSSGWPFLQRTCPDISGKKQQCMLTR